MKVEFLYRLELGIIEFRCILTSILESNLGIRFKTPEERNKFTREDYEMTRSKIRPSYLSLKNNTAMAHNDVILNLNDLKIIKFCIYNVLEYFCDAECHARTGIDREVFVKFYEELNAIKLHDEN